MFGGLLFPSSSHALYQRSHEPFKSPVPELGARLAYFPFQFGGAELELAAGPAKTEGGSSGSFWGARAHLIGQLPLNGVTPFALLGLGRLGAGSNATGGDSDPSIHFGVGAKVPLDDFVGVRLDLRDNLTQKWEAGPGVENAASQGSQVHHPEVLLGLTFTLDPHSAAKPAVDTDGDRVNDPDDKCPNEPGATADGCPPPANLDADHDGVEDSRDACPNEAGPVPTGCPDKDQDHDCVPIPVDQCPNESATTPNGCPDPDPDHDGVVGAADRCPREPETKNGYQDDDGCPDTLPAKVAKFSGVVAGIEFDTGLATIRPISKATLNEAVAVLKEYPTLRVLISGHTDNVGERDKNLALSAARADSVKSYLVSQGINAARVETRGAGPDQPIADNKDAPGRQKNRRIEFKLLSQ